MDPLATGVLITGVGKGTKQLQGFLDCTKSYEAVVLFGCATDSYDRLGKIVKRAPHAHITKAKVEDALKKFWGKTMQIPPVYSALRIDGKRLYEYAREGKELPRDIEKRPVEVTELDLVEWWEGGEHEHKWPTEEVSGDEREAAEKLFKKSEEAIKQVVNSSAGEEANGSSKRKRDSEHDGADNSTMPVSPPIPKKTKVAFEDADEPVMSGALPPDSDVEAASARTPVSDLNGAAESIETTIEDKGPPACKIRMTVTSGFYVRSLCHDLGLTVGSLGLMSELVRTRQGDFEVGKNVLEYSDLEEGEEVWGPQVEKLLNDWSEKHNDAQKQEKPKAKSPPRREAKQSYPEKRRRRNSSSSESG